MSSILKALRRLEEERARKSHAAPEIAANLLRGGGRRRSTPLWIWPTVVAFAALILAIFFWSWRPAPVVNQTVSPITLPAAIPVAAAGRGGEVIIEEVIDQRRPALLAPAKPPIPASTPVLTAKNVETKLIPAAEKSQPVAPFIEERESPVISVIAWQDDSAARMAVVDGLPVMTGEFVGTAKVQEILRDRILFIEEGRFFTVYIDPP